VFRDAVCAGGRDRASGGFGIDVVGLALQTANFSVRAVDLNHGVARSVSR
jgi:hypothetical protein